MPYPVRFQLYNDPSRETYTQLIPDVVADELPAYGYGKVIQVENDGSTSGPYYVVANISRIKQEPNPDHPGKSRIVYEVYLAREEEWEQFGEPEEFERIRNGTPL